MSTSFEDRIASLFSTREVRDKRLFEILTSDDDLVALVLRGHLIVEEMLFSAVAAHCQDPERLKDANLKFSQLLALFRSLEKIPIMKKEDWEAMTALNSLRNALAHRIEPKDVSARVKKLVIVIQGSERVKKSPRPLDSKESLKTALSYLFGRLSVIAVFQSALEELIRHQLIDKSKKPA